MRSNTPSRSSNSRQSDCAYSHRSQRAWALVLATIAGVLILCIPASAQTVLPESSSADGHRLSLVSGLMNPRGMVFGPDGALYVAEAGAGGTEPPKMGTRKMMVGRTARVSRITLDGQR